MSRHQAVETSCLKNISFYGQWGLEESHNKIPMMSDIKCDLPPSQFIRSQEDRHIFTQYLNTIENYHVIIACSCLSPDHTIILLILVLIFDLSKKKLSICVSGAESGRVFYLLLVLGSNYHAVKIFFNVFLFNRTNVIRLWQNQHNLDFEEKNAIFFFFSHINCSYKDCTRIVTFELV